MLFLYLKDRTQNFKARQNQDDGPSLTAHQPEIAHACVVSTVLPGASAHDEPTSKLMNTDRAWLLMRSSQQLITEGSSGKNMLHRGIV